MDNIRFQDIPENIRANINEISENLLQKLYSKFNFLYFISDTLNDCNSCLSQEAKKRIITFIFDNLKDFKFITYKVVNINSRTIKLNQINFSTKRNSLTNIINAIICAENKCFIFEKIDLDIMTEVINKLKEHKTSIINVSPNINSERTEEEKLAKVEIDNFCSNFTKEIDQNGFVSQTIHPIIGFLIRRYFYPTDYFENPSFFDFGYSTIDQFYQEQFTGFLDFNCFNTMLLAFLKTRIDQKERKVYINIFKSTDFIILREIYHNDNYRYSLVFHIKSFYIFLLKKRICPENLTDEFKREKYFCENFSHRCINRFYGFVKDDSIIIGFVYEFMCNGSLNDFVLKHPEKMDEIYSAMTILRIFQGLYFLQTKSLIHRDLKPSNILIDHQYIPYISDFETIRSVKDIESSEKTITNAIGSQYYTSPEQDEGKNVSFPTDIYSFGLIIYFIKEKKNLFSYKKSLYFTKNADDPVIHISNCSTIFQNIYLKCVEYSLKKRMTKEEIKSNLIDEVCSFHYIELYFLENNIHMNQFLYESFQVQEKKKLEKFITNLLLFVNLKVNDNYFVNLGILFEKGLEIEQNLIKAKEYYELAAKQDNPDGYNHLGKLYMDGIGVTQDFQKAKGYFELSAKKNNSDAFINLGNLYSKSNNSEKNIMKAIEYFELAAKKNNPRALFSLGCLYQNGLGVEKNYIKAHNYYVLAANKNDSDALFNLGYLYQHGIGVKVNYLTAKKFYELSAKQNNSNALFCLGYLYENNYGVEQNYLKAKYYYELASKQNNSEALCNLALFYLNGKGVEKNIDKAIHLLDLSSKHDNSNASYNLGYLYCNGSVVKQDFGKAKNYFESAAKQNNSKALYNLGVFYLKGISVQKDCMKAIQYFELAAKENNSEALNQLAGLYLSGKEVEQNISKAVEYFKLSVELNNPRAQNSLGFLYLHGFGVEKNLNKALQYYEMSAKQNDSNALKNLGAMYENGLGVVKDILRAIKYYESSAKQKNSGAYLNLGLLYIKGVGVEKNYTKAIEYLKLSAEQKNSCAFYILGYLYLFGFEVKKDFSKAKYYLEESSKLYDSLAFLSLSELYLNGIGVEKDYFKAKDYCELSAKEYNPEAFFQLSKYFIDSDIFGIDYARSIQYLLKSIALHEKKLIVNNHFGGTELIFIYNKYFYHANNDLGLIYLTVFEDLEKGVEYIKKAAFGEYPFAQNNYGLIWQLYFNKLGNAQYMYERSSKHHFALSEFNLGQLFEKEKEEKAIQYFIQASNDENEPLIFHNFSHYDFQLSISKKFIICLANLKLSLYYLNKKLNYEKSKKYFVRSFSSLNDKSYQFHFKVQKQISNNFYVYLRTFIFNFPLFNLSNQPNLKFFDGLDCDSNEINEINSFSSIQEGKDCIQKVESEYDSDEELLAKQKLIQSNVYNDESNMILLISRETDINDKVKVIKEPSELFDFAIKNEKLCKLFIEEIKNIIQLMNDIIYTPPYPILFGRITLPKKKKYVEKILNPNIPNIGKLFYEGFGIPI
ncbi:hypothetical protein M9Y10_008068 [Tritrichomonas musculus]|uniref:Protein kinase domain-containing protein n=1 Tax=Tritrichomonas musculus TaxID=1915356 RepID=A0ABR2IY29_9EUKA